MDLQLYDYSLTASTPCTLYEKAKFTHTLVLRLKYLDLKKRLWNLFYSLYINPSGWPCIIFINFYLQNIVPSLFIEDVVLKVLPIHFFGFLDFLFGYHFTCGSRNKWKIRKY